MLNPPWPAGPYRFDDISSARQDDGLGYIYLEEGGCAPTLAHTGDMVLRPSVNRALGNLFAAAPDLYEALDQAAEALRILAETAEEISLPGAPMIRERGAAALAALAKARGEPS